MLNSNVQQFEKIRLLQNPFRCKSEIRLQIIKLFYINLVLSQKRQFTKGLLVVHDVSFEINIAVSTIGIQDQNIFSMLKPLYVHRHSF